MLVDKLRRAKEQLKVYEKENSSFREELKKYKENKEYLVARLHDSDLKIVGHSKLMKESQEEIKKLIEKNFLLESEIEDVKKYFEKSNFLLVSEINGLKHKVETVSLQKKEMIAAFEDLCVLFKSFSLKI